MSEEVPPGWSYNPSAWSRRLPSAGMAALGFAIATYLALYQYGVVAEVWEPFFGAGSSVILHSSISTLLERKLGLPVTDAALGATGYVVDVMTGLLGGPCRWKTRPWVVLLYGFVVGSMGAGSLLLIILQPVLFGTGCTLCLASAGVSLSLIYPALDEALASLRHLKRGHDAGAGATHRVAEGGR